MAYPDTYEDCLEPIDELDSVDVVDYDRIQAMLSGVQDNVCACSEDAKDLLSTQLSQVNNGLRTLMVGLEDEINENESIIVNNNNTMTLII